MRAVVYTRVSLDRTGRGRSVEEQRVECERECERNGWTVVETLTDNDRSASRYAKKSRPAWARVHELLESGGVDVLVTWEASRAQRDLAAYVELREVCRRNGVSWSYSGKTFDLTDADDSYRAGLDALDAERESDRTSKRVRRSMAANAERGRPHGRRAFGFARVYDPGTGELVTQEAHPDEAPVVREIVERVCAGESLRTIAGDLAGRGLSTGTGAEWSPTAVRRIAVNPAYAGQRVHQGRVIGDASWPCIVSPEMHQRAVAILTNPARRATRQRERAHLLSGVARCGRCGGPMNCGGDRGARVYICRTSQHVTVRKQALEAVVVATLVERLSRPDGLASLELEPSNDVAEAQERVQVLRARLDEAAAEFAAGRLSAAMLGRVETQLMGELDEANRAARVRPMPATAEAMASAVDAAAFFDGLSIEQQVELVRALMSVTVEPTRRSKVFDPSRVRIEWLS